MRIKWAAGKIAAFDFDRGHFAAAVVHAQDDFFGFRFIVDINFPNFYTAFTQEIFGAAAVAAPVSTVNRFLFHFRRSGGLKEASNYLLTVWMRQEGSETQHDARRVRPGVWGRRRTISARESRQCEHRPWLRRPCAQWRALPPGVRPAIGGSRPPVARALSEHDRAPRGCARRRFPRPSRKFPQAQSRDRAGPRRSLR